MFNMIKNIFFKEEEEKGITSKDIFQQSNKKNFKCSECPVKDNCFRDNYVHTILLDVNNSTEEDFKSNCIFENNLKNFDNCKETLLIIDDNEGMVSFLEDDIEYLDEKGILCSKKINVLSISSVYAAFTLEILIEKEKGLNIKWAIIDITLGGSIMSSKGNIKYTGVDVLNMIYKYNPKLKFIFYTGNNLNSYIKRNALLIKQFKKITGKNIEEFILYKTSMDINERRKYISKHLFGKELK